MTSFGRATPSLTIEASSNIESKQYWVPIFGNASFIFTPPAVSEKSKTIEQSIPINSQNQITVYTLIIDVEAPYGLNESFNQFREEIAALWKDNKDIIIVLVGIFLTPFGAWAFDRFIKKERRKKKRAISHSD